MLVNELGFKLLGRKCISEVIYNSNWVTVFKRRCVITTFFALSYQRIKVFDHKLISLICTSEILNSRISTTMLYNLNYTLVIFNTLQSVLVAIFSMSTINDQDNQCTSNGRVVDYTTLLKHPQLMIKTNCASQMVE